MNKRARIPNTMLDSSIAMHAVHQGSMANIVANNLLSLAFAFNAHARSNLMHCCD
jgi:hypothetical protein